MIRPSSSFARCLLRNAWNSISDRRQRYFSRAYSCLFNLSLSRYLIAPYCRIHDLDEVYLAHYVAADGCATYRNFQSFFSRKLAAPLTATTETCWPCDGILCESSPLNEVRDVYIKGARIDARQIFGADSSQIPKNYAFVNIFLHNKDYHRIHTPVGGVITSIARVPGKLTILRPWMNGSQPSAPAFINERLNICVRDLHNRSWFLSAVGGPAVNAIQVAGNLSVGSSLRVGEELAFFSLGSTCCLAAPIFPRPLLIGCEIKAGDRFD
jgi:phosphatidylserine decarboxylase